MRAKRIELKVLPPSEENGGDAIDYKLMLLAHFKNAPTQGLTIGQIKARFALIDELKAAEGTFDIEHRSHEVLVKELETVRWKLVSTNLTQFVDDIRTAADAIAAPPKVVEPEPDIDLSELDIDETVEFIG